MSTQQKTILLEYLKTQLLGVLATVNEGGEPQAALVGITELPDVKLIFGTSNTTRKYKNLQNNPHVAIGIGHDIEAGTTVQYEGVAQELAGEELATYREVHLAKNPRARKFAMADSQRWFLVTPTWIRYTNVAAKPPEIFELTF